MKGSRTRVKVSQRINLLFCPAPRSHQYYQPSYGVVVVQGDVLARTTRLQRPVPYKMVMLQGCFIADYGGVKNLIPCLSYRSKYHRS